jgi:CheY-like chemotaxis protein
METRHRVLLVDDDPDLLEMYRDVLAQLPSKPEIRTASSGSRALAMLETEPFRLLLCDLKMPKVDGLQVISIVRRKYPRLRTVALTSVMDEQFRTRAYAMGVDQFWQKPATEQEIQMFLECLESLLGPDSDTGFRGVQSKSMVDIIQLECISQSSSVLRVTNGSSSSKIWIQDGEIIDAEADELRGEAAFVKILSWRAGSFETLPAEPNRPRTILKSYNALLLESAQAFDESRSQPNSSATPSPEQPANNLSKIEGLEFLIAWDAGNADPKITRGLENPVSMSHWARNSLEAFRLLGERLRAGALQNMEALGPQRNVSLVPKEQMDFCVGWRSSMSVDEITHNMKKVLSLWGS